MTYQFAEDINMKKRVKNEREYDNWEETDDNGRLYWKEIPANDKSGKIARYEKEVNKKEETLSFTQKILDKYRKLVEIHEKFPIDKGHIILAITILITLGIILF